MLKNARNNSRSPLSRRRKSVTEGSKIKQGGILGQDKTKRREDGLTTKTKSRFGRDVKVDRIGGAKVKTVTDKDGNQLKKKVKTKLLGRSSKSYKGGGKVVAQGADKADLRAERKQERMERKKDRKTTKDLKKVRKALVTGAKAGAKAIKKAKRVGDRNFKSDVKSGRLKPVSRKTKSQNTKRA